MGTSSSLPLSQLSMYYFYRCLRGRVAFFSKLALLLAMGSINAAEATDEKTTGLETATLGAGCFWCTEAVFELIDGVHSVRPGFSGGHVKDPSYREVCTGTTGHAEVAEITFDPEKVRYSEILDWFFRSHDPTTLNRQGADVGTHYRSVIFYHNEQQKAIAEAAREKWDASGAYDDPIVTEITAFEAFYPAEDYHNDYYKNNPDAGYCSFVIRPKLKKLGLE